MTYSETIRHHGNPFTVWTNPEINRVEVFQNSKDRRDFLIVPMWGPMDRACRFYHGYAGGEVSFSREVIRPGRGD